MIVSLLENWDRAFDEAVKAVKRNGILIYPTDTVYGIGGNALDEKVLQKAREMAGKESRLCVIIPNLEMLLKYFDINEDETKAITQSCPGPFIFMLKPRIRMPAENEKGKVGVMIPNNVFIRKVCFESNVPVLMAQCNASEFSKLGKETVERADVAIDGGKTMLGKEATIIDVREGIGQSLGF